jgi:hypothetical protein
MNYFAFAHTSLELRLVIYEDGLPVFYNVKVDFLDSVMRINHRHFRALIATCRQMRSEADALPVILNVLAIKMAFPFPSIMYIFNGAVMVQDAREPRMIAMKCAFSMLNDENM